MAAISTSRHSTFRQRNLVFSALLSMSVLAGCAPTADEKVSPGGANRSGNGQSASGVSDAAIGDRSFEYSRAMLIELSDVARQTETVMKVVRSRQTVDPVPTTSSNSPAALTTQTCRAFKDLPATNGTMKFEVRTQEDPAMPSVDPQKDPAKKIKGCTEMGSNFAATQAGREFSFATLVTPANQLSFANFFKVQGVGYETILVPTANPRDSLLVKGDRFLEAEFVEELNGERLYRFSYENKSNYTLNLKAYVDNGTLSLRIKGLLIVDSASGRVKGFRAVESYDRMDLQVQSAREIRGGGLERREFYGSLQSPTLDLNLAACSLPTGALTSRFTIKPMEGNKKYLVDSKVEFESSAEMILNKLKPDVVKGQARLCAPAKHITMTDFYQGLLY